MRAAGSLQVDHGVIRQITGWSGHYRPKERDFDEMIGFLESQGVDMSQVREAPPNPLCIPTSGPEVNHFRNCFYQVEKFLTKMKPGSKMGQALDNSDDQQPLLCPCPMLLRRSAPVQSVYPGSNNRGAGNRPFPSADVHGVQARLICVISALSKLP